MTMNRAEHLAEALRLNDAANHEGHTNAARADRYMAQAQFHATIAAIPDLQSLQMSIAGT